MPNLELSDTELDNLFVLLSIHSTQSEFSTFSVYEKVWNMVKSGDIYADTHIYNRNWEARQTLTVLDNGLIEFVKPAPEEEPNTVNPFVEFLIDSLDVDVADWEEVDDNTFQLFIDDKMVTVSVTEPEVYP